ncbi:uncharacterized protein [Amphiura filiformis]|uniref:uncharacterized protein n=1 Tax=Amphiura filiformis TaxID=82378 RepID=UPI003B2127A5
MAKFGMELLNLLVFLCVLHFCNGSHFRGGSMSWKPIGNNFIKLKYKVGFKFNHEEPGFDRCTTDAQHDRTELSTSGKLECESCTEYDKMKDLKWICNDFEESEDSAVGYFTYIYHIPENNTEFDISYEHCCWINLESPIDKYGGAKGWKMLAHVDVSPRPDNGKINSSPVPANIPMEKFYKGCHYHLRIPVYDRDNDAIRCRYANEDKGECPADGNKKACGPNTDGLKINYKDCTLDFDTRNVEEGNHAVNVIIEDYIRPVKRKSQPLSKVSLLFLLYVERESTSCLKPMIIDPPSCKSIRPDEHFEMVIRAEPGDPWKPISKIRTQKPYGMRASQMVDDPDVPGRKMVTLRWYPTPYDLGEHSVCFSALDSDSYTSGLYCTFIYVERDPLQPVPEKSTPGEDDFIVAGETWIVKFNKQVNRPKSSAYIRIVNPETDKIAYQVDVTDSSVVYEDNMINFLPPREGLLMAASSMKIQYELQLDGGIAMPKEGGCASEPAKWIIGVRALKPGELQPPGGIGIGARPRDCNPTTLEIFVPNETVQDVKDCFLHLPEGAVDVIEQVTLTPYELCCPGSCEKDTAGKMGPPGHAGRPGPPGYM